MKRYWTAAAALAAGAAVVVAGTVFAWPWYATSIAAFALLLFALLDWYEQRAADPKYLALVATVSAVASVGRAALQGIPSVQPVTFFAILAGYSFGPATGAMVGALTAFGSNLVLGEGAWTPWQMFAWGLAGFSAGLLRRVCPQFRRSWLVPFGFAWGFLFGWIMNTWLWLGGPVSIAAFLLLCAQSAAMDFAHGAATAGLLLVAGPAVHRVFERYRRRLDPPSASAQTP